MAVGGLNEMEGRSSTAEEQSEAEGLYLRGERSGKMILAVNFLYITRKSPRACKESEVLLPRAVCDAD